MDAHAETLLAVPPGDGIAAVRFGPASNQLLIASWDSVSAVPRMHRQQCTHASALNVCVSCVCRIALLLCLQTTRLYDADANRPLATFSFKAPCLDCCFVDEEHGCAGSIDRSLRMYAMCCTVSCIPTLLVVR